MRLTRDFGSHSHYRVLSPLLTRKRKPHSVAFGSRDAVYYKGAQNRNTRYLLCTKAFRTNFLRTRHSWGFWDSFEIWNYTARPAFVVTSSEKGCEYLSVHRARDGRLVSLPDNALRSSFYTWLAVTTVYTGVVNVWNLYKSTDSAEDHFKFSGIFPSSYK
jgi:hypothetical protein